MRAAPQSLERGLRKELDIENNKIVNLRTDIKCTEMESSLPLPLNISPVGILLLPALSQMQDFSVSNGNLHSSATSGLSFSVDLHPLPINDIHAHVVNEGREFLHARGVIAIESSDFLG